MKVLPCPFCGGEAVGRSDGAVEARPFYVRCSRPICPAHAFNVGHADAELALLAWNRRVQLPPETRESVADIYGFTTKSLIRGEMICMNLDRTGVLSSDVIAFSPHSEPLMKKPRA